MSLTKRIIICHGDTYLNKIVSKSICKVEQSDYHSKVAYYLFIRRLNNTNADDIFKTLTQNRLSDRIDGTDAQYLCLETQ